MLKQLFDEKSILKVISGKDIWRWKVLKEFKDSEQAAEHISKSWQKDGINIQPLISAQIKGRTTYRTQNLEDTLAIKLVDRYIRRIYKVRQSDRNRMVKQVITLLEDPGDFCFIRFDIKNCYESISFRNMLTKTKEDMILSPNCINVLEQVVKTTEEQGQNGLPRGLPISTTLAELYLEKLDDALSRNDKIIYCARYVDDCIVVTPTEEENNVQSIIKKALSDLNLKPNKSKSSTYKANQAAGALELLGYSLSSKKRSRKSNLVTVEISNHKLNKIKERIMLSFLAYKNDPSRANFKLFKDRLFYLSTLRTVKKSKNGPLLAGNAYNYKLADQKQNDQTIEIPCLKKLDRFYKGILNRNQSLFSSHEQAELLKISFYGNAKNKLEMKTTKIKALHIQKAWSSQNV